MSFPPCLRRALRLSVLGVVAAVILLGHGTAHATPANKIALVRYYDRHLPRRLDNCTTCHLPATSAKPPTNLSEFPHNAFGKRLFAVSSELAKTNKRTDLEARLKTIAKEDSDGDGVDNETELLLGHAPGDPKDKPAASELATAAAKRAAFARFLVSYRWQPFESVKRPNLPKLKNRPELRNPIDLFLNAEYAARELTPRPPIAKNLLLRRVTIDLTGLAPTPEELRAFLSDTSPNAYEKVVDRLLASPRYGERWGRHWMDVWRYSDWAGWADGGQIRDSKPHIWRWRDWIVESLNKGKGYDRMVQEMLAADELAPEDTDALRATGFLVRNYKLLSREQWLEDTVGHTARAFQGLTMHCAKCHDHLYDPISQKDYYRMRAIFEPHNVRTDRIVGQIDTSKDGLVRAYDADSKVLTFLFTRGDERQPDKNQPMLSGVPPVLGGTFTIKPVTLPRFAAHPDRRDFVKSDLLADAATKRETARKERDAAAPEKRPEHDLAVTIAEQYEKSLTAILRAEDLEEAGQKASEAWKLAATEAADAQRLQTLTETKRAFLMAQNALATAQKPSEADQKALQTKVTETEKALQAAETRAKEPPTEKYTPRPVSDYPAESTGRRLAFARWLTEKRNPLTARVAVNHVWARHFGQGIVPTLSDFGRNGRPPSHPQLLDWLATEFMANGWQFKPLHRLIVTSRAYRMASTGNPLNVKKDPDNVYLWRMNSRRLEAEAVRDNVLYLAGDLDETMGGAEVDHLQGLVSKRRSLYLRHAAEKEVPFLKIFDNASVAECYERRPSVMPQQALALANSELTLAHAKLLAQTLLKRTGTDPDRFLSAAFEQTLCRQPTAQERKLCTAFLREQSRRSQKTQPQVTAATPATDTKSNSGLETAVRPYEHLILILFNHNDFVTIR